MARLLSNILVLVGLLAVTVNGDETASFMQHYSKTHAKRSKMHISSHGQTMSSHEALSASSQELHNHLQSVGDKLPEGATRNFLKSLHLCAPCNHYERFGEANDGGYVMCTDGLEKGLVGAYSYGVNGFDGWGMAVASRYHIPLHEYDCTNSKVPKPCSGCDAHFHQECIMNLKGDPKNQFIKASFKTLAQQLQESGHGNAQERSLLLKLDVEGAEWKLLAEEPVENIRKFREVVLEFHNLNQRQDHELYFQAAKKLQDAGFAVSHLHGNDWGGPTLLNFGEYSIPNVLEATYLQKPAQGCAANIPYHLAMDAPNNPIGPTMDAAVLPDQ